MAAGFLRHLAGDRVEVRSAGTMPAEHINPSAVEAMAEVGIDLRDVAVTLEREGVASFQKSFADLLAALEAKAASFSA